MGGWSPAAFPVPLRNALELPVAEVGANTLGCTPPAGSALEIILNLKLPWDVTIGPAWCCAEEERKDGDGEVAHVTNPSWIAIDMGRGTSCITAEVCGYGTDVQLAAESMMWYKR